ncbi:Vacuolar protein sorting-associated protein 13 [Hondaea fermentalgiana]|uniref:Vacuolar protein sorting-associated protein 13 n=1 Tax=Hondaea fermentalgiana TaxID=2315210 RepID=A0A2R5GEQ2_9STRA|nr:Vacuolar protein sorting-associated protein 13 [Hondaea fermentalgiana]|eukprot:GBG26294.1 Vacuolar protein sorting-associated protein 13 [Hondaea fermentalgiana]
MLEGIVAGVLNKSLGWLIDDLNSDNLSVGISKGDIFLQNVKVKASALKDAGLPLELAHGSLGKLRIRIPWTNLYNAPVRVEVDDVFLRVRCARAETVGRAGAEGHADGDGDSETDEQESREAVLEALDASRKRALAAFQKGLRPAPAESWSGRLISGITCAVIQNLLVTVTNVHIQIDHRDNVTDRVFQVGLAIPVLKVAPIASSREPEAGCVRKTASVEGLRIYHREPEVANVSPLDIFDADTYLEDGVSLLLEPLDVNVRIPALYVKGSPPASKPALQIIVDIKRVAMSFDARQTKQVTALATYCAQETVIMTSGCKRPRLRPDQSPGAWWTFVLHRVRHDLRARRRRLSWLRLAGLFTKSQTYASLYTRKFPGGAATVDQLQATLQLSVQDSAKLRKLENSLTDAEVMAFRTLSELRLVQEFNLEQQESFSHRWLGVGGSSTRSIREHAAALARAEAAKFYGNPARPDDSVIQFDVFAAVHECKLQLAGLLSVEVDYLATKAIKQGPQTKGDIQILDVRMASDATLSKPSILAFPDKVIGDPCCEVIFTLRDGTSDEASEIVAAFEPLDFWLDASLPRAIESYARVSLLGASHVINEEDIIIEEAHNLRTFNQGKRRDAQKAMAHMQISLHMRDLSVHVPMPSRRSFTRSEVDAGPDDAILIHVEDVKLHKVDEPNLCTSNIALSCGKISLDLVKVLPASSCVLRGVETASILRPLDFGLDVTMNQCAEDQLCDLLAVNLDLNSSVQINMSTRSLRRVLALQAALEAALDLPSTSPDPTLKSIAPGALQVTQAEAEQLAQRVRMRVNVSLVSFVLDLQASEAQTGISISGSKILVEQVSRTFGSQARVEIASLHISGVSGVVDALVLKNAYFWRNAQSALRPVWLPVPGFLGDNTDQILFNVDDAVVFRATALDVCAEDQLLSSVMALQQEAQQQIAAVESTNMQQEKSRNGTPPLRSAPPRSISAFVLVDQSTMCMRRADDTGDVAVIRIASVEATLLDMKSKHYGDGTEPDRDFFATAMVGGARAHSGGRNAEEGLLWTGETWPTPTLCDIAWMRRVFTAKDAFVSLQVSRETPESHFDVSANLARLRLHVSSPLAANLLQFANEMGAIVSAYTAPSPDADASNEGVGGGDIDDDDDNDFTAARDRRTGSLVGEQNQGADVAIQITEIAILIPRDPSADTGVAWDSRDMVVSQLHELAVQASFGPGRLGTTTDGSSRRDSLYSDPSAILGDDSDGFYDARSAASDGLSARNFLEMSLSAQVALTNFSIETWSFHRDLYQTLVRLSMATAIQMEPGHHDLRFNVTPAVIACSQEQYALLLDAVAANDFASISASSGAAAAPAPAAVETSQARSRRTSAVSNRSRRTSRADEIGSARNGQLDGEEDNGNCHVVSLNCSFESLTVTLFLDAGGDQLPRPRERDEVPSREKRALGRELLRFHAKGMLATLESPAFPDEGTGEVVLQHMELRTSSTSGRKHHALKTDREPFFVTTFALAPDLVEINGRLASITIETFELVSAMATFSQVQDHLRVRSLDDVKAGDGLHSVSTRQFQESRAANTSNVATEAAFLQSYHARQSNVPQRILLPKNVRFSMSCEEFAASLSPAKSAQKLVFALAFQASAKVVKDARAEVHVAVQNINLARRNATPNSLPARVTDASSVGAGTGADAGADAMHNDDSIVWYLLRPFSLNLQANVQIPGQENPTLRQDVVSAELNVESIQVEVGREEYALLMEAASVDASSSSQHGSGDDKSTETDARAGAPASSSEPTTSTETYAPAPLPKPRLQRFELTASQYDFRDLHCQSRVDLDVLLSASYWNKRHGSWESMIDPWCCHIGADSPQFVQESPKERLVQTLGYDKEAPVNPLRLASLFANLESTQMLNVNVTSAAVQQLTKAQDLTAIDNYTKRALGDLAHDRRRAPGSRSADDDSLIVRNETGSQVTARLRRVNVTSTGGFFGALVGDSDDHPFYRARIVGCWAFKSDPTGALWKKRYITVEGGSLKYYKSMKAFRKAQPQGIIKLRAGSKSVFVRMQGMVPPRIYRSHQMLRECAFQVVTPSRVYGFITFGLEDKERMTRALLQVLAVEPNPLDIEGSRGINAFPAKVYSVRVSRGVADRVARQDTDELEPWNDDKARTQMHEDLETTAAKILLDGHSLYVFDEEVDLEAQKGDEVHASPLIAIDLQAFCVVRQPQGRSHRIEIIGPEFRVVADNVDVASNICSDVLSRTRTALSVGPIDEVMEQARSDENNAPDKTLRIDFQMKLKGGKPIENASSLRVIMLPSGLDARVEDLETLSGTVSLPTSTKWCTVDQILRFDVLGGVSGEDILASMHMILSAVERPDDLQRREEISLYSTLKDTFARPDLRDPCATLIASVTLPESIISGSGFGQRAEDASGRIEAGQNLSLKLAGGEYRSAHERQAPGLRIQIDGFVESVPVPVDRASRFAVPLHSQQSDLYGPDASPELAATSLFRFQNVPFMGLVDIHFEEGEKLAKVSSCAMLKNRLQEQVNLTFQKLALHVPLKADDGHASEGQASQRLAFDQRVDTAWVAVLSSSRNGDRASNCAEYVSPTGSSTKAVLYSVASGPSTSSSSYAPSAWVLQGYAEDTNEWVDLDARSEVVFTEAAQLRDFAVEKVHACTRFRIRILDGKRLGSEGPGRTRVQSKSLSSSSPSLSDGYKVHVGNVVLYWSSENDFRRDVSLLPNETTHVPIECLGAGGVLWADNGEPTRIHEFLDIHPWRMANQPARRKPRYVPVSMDLRADKIAPQAERFCVMHVSFHHVRDIAKTLSERDGSSPRWILTLDPPVRVENVLPFALEARLARSVKGQILAWNDDGSGNARAVVARGEQEQFFDVDPAIGTEGSHWRQNLEGGAVVEAIMLHFAIRRESELLRSDPDEAPMILGEDRESTYQVSMQGNPDLFIDVQVIPASAKEERDPDHQHTHADDNIDEYVDAVEAGAEPDEADEGFGAALSIPSSATSFVAEALQNSRDGDAWDGPIPCLWRSRSVPPLRVILYCRFLVLNWSGLPLIFAGKAPSRSLRTKIVPQAFQTSEGDRSEREEEEKVDEGLGMEKVSLGKAGSKSAKKLLRLNMFSPKEEKMTMSLENDRSGWSREFGLVVGMSGEVTIPPTPGASIVHQVGVQVTSGSGIFLRTKVVTLTPRFVVANLTQEPIYLQQIGANEGDWQLQLDAGVFAPFHPVDVNGDGALDAKDFAARIGVQQQEGSTGAMMVSPHFHLDIVKEHLLLLGPDDAKPASMQECTWRNTLAAPVVARRASEDQAGRRAADLINANVELIDNVVRIVLSKPHRARAYEYRIDNLSSFVRIGVVQHKQSHANMVMLGPDEHKVEFVWPAPGNKRTVEVFLELVGLDALRFIPRSKYRTIVSVDFDSLRDPLRVQVGDLQVEVRVSVEGITRVLSVSDLAEARARNQVRKVLQEHVQRIESRLLSDQQLLLSNMTPAVMKANASGDGHGSSAAIDGDAYTSWRSAQPPASRTKLECELDGEHGECIDAYSFTVASLSLHPRRWKLYGRRARAGTDTSSLVGDDDDEWELLDDRTDPSLRKDLKYFEVSRSRQTRTTAFRLPFGSPPCSAFKVVVEGPFEVRHLNFYRSRTSLAADTLAGENMQETSEIWGDQTHVWIALLEARDLPVMDIYSSDPYVKIHVGNQHQRSKTVSRSLHPCFDEEFYFDLHGPLNQVLEFEVFDKDLFTSDDLIGRASIELDNYTLRNGSPMEVWVTLWDGDAPRGQLRLAMQVYTLMTSEVDATCDDNRLGSIDAIVEEGDMNGEGDDAGDAASIAKQGLECTPSRPELSSVRFPALFEEELGLLRALRDKLVKEGGVLRALSTFRSVGTYDGHWSRQWMRRGSLSRTPSNGSFASPPQQTRVDHGPTLQMQDLDTDIKVRLNMTVLQADKIIDPLSIGWKSQRGKLSRDDIEVYCVVSYGDRVLRTDPMPMVRRNDAEESPSQARSPSWMGQPASRQSDRTSTQAYEFEETFEEVGPLGLQLERLDDGSFCVRTIASESAAARKSRLRPGLRLTGIQNTRLSADWSLSALRDMLGTSPRPLRLRFEEDMVSVHPEPPLPTAIDSEAELARISWMQQLTFDEVDTLRARARQESDSFGTNAKGLEGQRARISLYARDRREAPSLDLSSAGETDKEILVPLLFMFGEDIETDSELNAAREMRGDKDVLLGHGTVLLPELSVAPTAAGAARRQVDCPLALPGNIFAGQVSLEVSWNAAPPDASDIVKLALDVRLAGLGISLVDTTTRQCELAYMSVRDARCYVAQYGNGRQVLDFRLGALQVDNQLPSPVHPIVLSAAPVPYAWLTHEEACASTDFVRKDALERATDIAVSQPAFLLTVVKRDLGDSSSMYVEYCEAFLQEVNLRLEERWLTAVQEFAASFSSQQPDNAAPAVDAAGKRWRSKDGDESSSDGASLHDTGSARDSERERGQNSYRQHQGDEQEGRHAGQERDEAMAQDGENAWSAFCPNAPFQWVDSLSARSGADTHARILIERADLKPVKINLTFSMTSDVESRADNRLKILHLMQGIPVLAALFSALVNTVANITDAPLRFNSLQIFNESLSQTMLRNTFVQHIMGQLLGNLSQMGNLLASADLLGSPVQLIGSFGQGAYSFFYEPALAMSMGGYLSIGKGLRKGGVELVRSTTHGASASLEKFAESASRALSQASLDSRYVRLQARRRMDVVHEPINLIEGALSSSEALSLGMLDALTGIVSLPVRDVSYRGATGVITGAGKAVAGIFVKPVCAMCDATSLFFKGVRNTTETLHKQQLPVRLPRMVRAGHQLGPYSAREAIGVYLLRRCGIADTQTYVYHEYVFGAPAPGTPSGLLDSHAQDEEVFEHWVEHNPLVLLVTEGLVLLLHIRTTETLWCAPLSSVRTTGFGRMVEVVLASSAGAMPIVRRASAMQQHQQHAVDSRRVTPGIAADAGGAEPLRLGTRLFCKTSEAARRVEDVITLAQEGGRAREQAAAWEQQQSIKTAMLAIQDPTGARKLGAAIDEHVRQILTSERSMDANDHEQDAAPAGATTGGEEQEEGWIAIEGGSAGEAVASPETKLTPHDGVRQVAGLSVLKAVITTRKVSVSRNGSPYTAYRIVVASAESDDVWIVWRRYSEFRRLRDALMQQLQKSRTALAIPARSPWRLSKTALNQRQYGLNLMLQELMHNTVMRESPLVVQFLTTDADTLGATSWASALRLKPEAIESAE